MCNIGVKYMYQNAGRALKSWLNGRLMFLKMRQFISVNSSFSQKMLKHQGPVVQNFVSLTMSLSPQFANYITTSKANILLFFVEKM